MLQSHFGQLLWQLGVYQGARIAVAVSGGVDSIALLSLATKWAENGRFPEGNFGKHASWLEYSPKLCVLLYYCAGGHPRPIALTVDHNLREGSRQEAEHACKVADLLGAPSKRFELRRNEVWPPRKTGDLLLLARQHRYSFLYQECCCSAIPVLLTAHHAGNFSWTPIFNIADCRSSLMQADYFLQKWFIALQNPVSNPP